MDTTNSEQAEFWGESDSGAKWITYEDQLDANHAAVLDLVLDRADLRPDMQVLDIGCGTGTSVLQAAGLVGAKGHVTGADISAPFMDRARTRAADAKVTNATFLLADAQVYPFAPDSFDAIISRFGVMFFADPTAAFANMAKGLRRGGRMTFAAWGPLDGNPWFKLPHVAAVRQLGQPPKLDPNGPGPLAFRDLDRVSALFKDAGLEVETAQTLDMELTPNGTLSDVVDLTNRIGPAARTVAHFDGTPDDIAAIAAAVHDAFQSFETPNGVRIPAQINLFQARRV